MEKDLRFRRTQADIYESLVILLKHKKFEEITVTEIVERAGISRSAFYNHYEDKYSLIEFYKKKFVVNANKNIFITNVDNLSVIFKRIMIYLETEGELLQVLLLKKGNEKLRDEIIDLFKQNAKKNVLPRFNMKFTSDLDKDFFISICSGAMLSYIEEWTSGKANTEKININLIMNEILKIISFQGKY